MGRPRSSSRSLQGTNCIIHTNTGQTAEKVDYGDSEHPQIWNFSIFSGMGSGCLKLEVVGGSAGRERLLHLQHNRVPVLME